MGAQNVYAFDFRFTFANCIIVLSHSRQARRFLHCVLTLSIFLSALQWVHGLVKDKNKHSPPTLATTATQADITFAFRTNIAAAYTAIENGGQSNILYTYA